MTKAATLTVGLSLLLSATAVSYAQAPAQESAVNEAVVRQAQRIQLRQKLEEAASAQQRGDLPSAAKLYDKSWDLVQGIGYNNVEAEAAQARSGLAAVRLELARQAQSKGDYRGAAMEVNDVLRVDPSNAAAIEFKAENDKTLEANKYKMPDADTVARVPAILKDKGDAAIKVQNGKLLFEMGKMAEAKKVLVEAAKEDPQNQAAYYYLNLINEANYDEALNKRDVDSRKRLVDIENAWYTPANRDLLPVPNMYARTNLINTSPSRQVIYAKLNNIRLDNVTYDGLPLTEVVKTLDEETRKRDPEKHGLNFLVNQNIDSGGGGGAPAGPGAIDPNTGLPIAAAAPAEKVDMSSITIKIVPALHDLRLADVLDAIVKVADPPIKYSVEDYAVVFSLKGREATPLYTRQIKVDPNTFMQGLESVVGFDWGAIAQASNQGGGGGGGGGGGIQQFTGGGGGGSQGGGLLSVPRVNMASSAFGGGGQAGGGQGVRGVTRTNDMERVQAFVRQFFLTMGIDLNPPKTIFFNDREGTLFVRATLQDLDTIEAAVQTLNIAPPQVHIKTKFVEVAQNDQRALGFDWYLGNVLMGGGALGLQGGTAPQFQGAPSAANPSGNFPTAAGPPAASDQILTPGLRNVIGAQSATVPAIATLSGILTDPQFRVVLHALEQRDGTDLLAESSVTTLSGRQTEIEVVDLKTIVIGNNVGQTGGGGLGGIGTTIGATGGGVIGSQVNYSTETLPFGPSLDVIPYVSADGFTIQMTIIPTYAEFIGYDDPGGFIPQAQSVSSGASGAAVPLTAQLPLPHFRIRQVTTSAIVWDGQTVVLGGLIAESVTKIKDKVPVIGDLPLVGRLFRSESSSSQKKNLMIFVTPTIIDPAGNRKHSEDEMPFAQNAIPVQKPFAPAAQ